MVDREDFKLAVGDRIRQAREDAKMTQTELGEAIGLSGNSAMAKVYQMEKGIAGIDFYRICLIAKATGKSLYFFADSLID